MRIKFRSPSSAGAGVRPIWVGGVVVLVVAMLAPSISASPVRPAVDNSGFAASPGSPTFTLRALSPDIQLAPSFWGADARIYYPANSTLASAFTGAGLSYVRWPGGAVGDEYNISANRIFREGGQFDTPPTSLVQFSQWCAAVQCRAIVQLPAEIDSPSTAAYQVAYIERTVGFQPAFYELGNEPAHWKHFGIPWSQWNSSQHTGATPAQYASVVHAYISAIRAVDPTARILGLPGVGTGGYNEASWISATVAENGPNLSGVAIHVYPAGPGSGTTPSLASFYASLSGGGTIAARVPADRIAVQKACPNCTNPIPVIVTELGSGNGGRGFDAFMKSYRDVPYIATELLQAMTLNVTNVDLFALEGTYPGSILGPNSALTPIGTFYSAFADRLGFGVLPTVEARDIPGFHLVVTTGRSTGEYNLLAVNTNVTTSQSLSLSGSGFPLGPGVVVGWNATSPAPRTISYATGIPTNFTIPPGGIVLIGALPVLGRVTPGLTSVGLPSQENQPLAPQVASPGTAIPGGVDLPPSAARSSIARWAE